MSHSIVACVEHSEMRENWCEKQNTRCAHILQYPHCNQPHHRYTNAKAGPIVVGERANTPQLDGRCQYKAPKAR